MNKEHQELYNASRHVKDRKEISKIYLVSMVKYQNISIAKASELLMKSYNWGKECMQRYDELGLDGLKTLPKSGRPLLLSNIRFKKIIDMTRRENGSVDPKQVMHNIKRKTEVKYHISNIRKRLHKFSFVSKAPKRIHVNAAPASVCYNWSQNTRRQIRLLEERGFAVGVQDECIIKYDSLSGKKLWIEISKNCYVKSTGFHKKVVVFGLFLSDGRQMFASYDLFDAKSFLKFLKMAHQKFGKICIITDRAAQHRKSKIIKKYISENKDEVKLLFFPTSSPFLSAVEECWYQAKRALAVTEYYETFENMKYTISEYFRTVRFKVSIMDFVMRKAVDCSYF